jgi:hypothetical protein
MTRTVAMLIALVVCAFFGAGSAGAQSDSVMMTATVNGQDVGSASSDQPLRLDPDGWADVAVTLTNSGGAAVSVRRVDLAGRVLGLTFFSYATSVDLTIAPGATETLRYRLDLSDLESQATGLMRGELAVVDANRDTVATLSTVADVRGSLVSVYGLFGIALAVLTALALLDTALALAKHRLSMNRWQRGLRFLAPGVGIGLVLVFTASVARLWVPDLGLWLVVAGLTAAASFALGYFSPTPVDDDDLDGDLDDGAFAGDDFVTGEVTPAWPGSGDTTESVPAWPGAPGQGDVTTVGRAHDRDPADSTQPWPGSGEATQAASASPSAPSQGDVTTVGRAHDPADSTQPWPGSGEATQAAPASDGDATQVVRVADSDATQVVRIRRPPDEEGV